MFASCIAPSVAARCSCGTKIDVLLCSSTRCPSFAILWKNLMLCAPPIPLEGSSEGREDDGSAASADECCLAMPFTHPHVQSNPLHSSPPRRTQIYVKAIGDVSRMLATNPLSMMKRR